ncbi:MAG: hypothetical protein HGA86_04835 [Anaerolineaceae bacterium]|nr:hypothetical protein [Anaerolineaceae bacterium]
MDKTEIIFLKLGGSLITNKFRPHTAKRKVILRLADEIKEALSQNEKLRVVLGHGSGSFGHIPAKKFNTRMGVSTKEEWAGFLNVWQKARALNIIVTDIMLEAGLPVISMPVSAFVVTQNGIPGDIQFPTLESAIRAGLIPILFGDTVFDSARGGAILSTEEIFSLAIPFLHPSRVLVAGVEPGVWADYPKNQTIVDKITSRTYTSIKDQVLGSAAVDVTGGMFSKVEILLKIVQDFPDMECTIFSGVQPGNITKALLNNKLGTTIRS